ncbi:MAG: PfaD family polyunsaturated fatty acid/polyketide biosynthesis protein [Gammaproteobacteria bacterium]|nr:PfaD family polyunsaturated fatty acid/polyketide biosynthesis protein [Gammaproteobacteria bacterium]
MTQTATQQTDQLALAQNIRQALYLIQHNNGYLALSAGHQVSAPWQVVGYLPAIYPERLGSQTFLRQHGVRFAYVTGAMAGGIAAKELVIAMAKANMLGFFGSAGLSFARVTAALDEFQSLTQQNLAWGINLIHTPTEPELERKLVELYIEKDVRCISASAFMQATPNIVRLACHGLSRNKQGEIQRRHFIFAKLSQPNMAQQFLSAPPTKILTDLVTKNLLTTEEAELGAQLPLAANITVEADSGGHTDNRPLPSLLSSVLNLRYEIARTFPAALQVNIGAAGGLGEPKAIAGAFAMGADYVVTGSINQATIEAGSSPEAKKLLAQADINDVIMAPAADMFELGVKLQVLKRGTFFAARGQKLADYYQKYNDINDIPKSEREKLEAEVFQASIETIWQQTREFWQQRNPKLLAKAEQNPKQKMALIFRWYLGNASRWASQGEASRQRDYQIWCGPAMGAYNRWVKDAILEPLENRHAAQIALNLLEGAAVVTRAQQLRSFGFNAAPEFFNFKPRLLKL